MFRVSTFVAPSRISGVGVFAAESIKRGTRIWEFTEGVDWLLTAEDLQAFPEPFQSRLRHYVYRDQTGRYVLCGDNAKFMNHHVEPNCTDRDPRYTVTLRTIHAGEELTCDYREFDEDFRINGVRFAGVGSNGHP